VSRTLPILLLLLATASGIPARAERASDLINFAFASRLGSGIYQTSGRTLWILRVPASVTVLRPSDSRTIRGSVLFPVTVGILDFEPEDILESGLPDRFDSMGITPGLRFDVPAGPVWTLSPFAQGGPVRDLSTDSTSWVYSIGVTAEARIPKEAVEWVVRGELAWSGMNPHGEELKETFGEWISGFEVWSPLPARIGDADLVLGGFMAGTVYWGRARFVGDPDFQPRLYSVQGEVGVVLSTRPRTYVWKVRVPDVGLSTRFGEGLQTIRLVLGKTF
jgi:hypothetical protein